MGTAYNPKIVTDGLVLCLDAANTKSYPGSGTTWTDLSLSLNTGTLTNGPTFSSTNGGVLNFDGVNDYVTVSNVPNFNTTNQFTASLWARSNNSTWNNNGFLLVRRNTGTGQFIIHPSSGTRSVSYYTITNTGYNSIAHTPDSITSFNNYTMTYNAGSLNAFFNGELVISGSVGTTLNSYTDPVYIGSDLPFNRYLNGSIGIVWLYNRALTSIEISQNYNATRGRYVI